MTTAIAGNPTSTTTKATPNEDGAATTSQVVSFQLANEIYGLDIMRVQEIILMGDITNIPEVPSYIRGLINLRGKVIPIVDLRKRFGLDACETTEYTRIIVVNAGETTLGVVVDAVSEVQRIKSGEIEPPPSGLVGMEQAYINGLVKMEKGIMILLNMENILSPQDQLAMSSSVGQATI